MKTPFDKLYKYQNDTISVTNNNSKGIVCLPTGTGKTYIQAAIVANDIIENPNQFRIYVINAPRILLTFQLLKEVYGFLINSNIESRYMFVHSGGTTDEKDLEEIRIQSENNIPFSEIGSGTSIESIKEMMVKAKEQNLPLILFSTYNSANRIEIARKLITDQPISIVLNDEAHYLVQEQFHNILTELTSSRCYFFTATTKYTPSDLGRGMNNSNLYGKILYSMTPREAIDLGKMVRPRLHFVTTTGVYNTDDYDKSLNRIIIDSFKQHEKIISSNSQTAKILVSTRGTQDIVKFINSKECEEIKKYGVSIYAVASNQEIGNDINGEKVTRQEFLRRLKIDGETKDKKLIVFHYDILAEGIDVSGFTGIMPLRTLSKSKFLQTFGRSARLNPEDRLKLENKEIKPIDLDKMNKPYAYIIIPNIIHTNEDDKTHLIQLITELRSYGFKPYEDIISSSIVKGIPEIDEIDGLNGLLKKLPNVGELIENLEALIEDEKLAILNKASLLRRLFSRVEI